MTFTVTWNLDALTGGPSSQQRLQIESNVPAIIDKAGNVVFDRAIVVEFTGGTGSVTLPDNTCVPHQFGYTIRFPSSWERGRVWRTPALAPNATVDLSDLTDTTPLPVPPGYDQQLDEIRQQIADLPSGGGGGSATWPVPGTPTTFPPSAHGHVIGDVADLTATLAGKETPAGAQSKADAAQAAATSAAAADATAKANAAATASSAADRARANHTGAQAISTVDGLQATLDAKETPAGAQSKVDTASTADRARANHTGSQSLDTTTDSATRLAFLPTERTKLQGVATGATANATDAQLRDRATHTGTQSISSVSGLQNALDTDAAALALHALQDVAVAAGGTIPAGRTGVASTAGTYSAPTPAASVSNPPQRFGIRNTHTAAITLSFPDEAGNALSLTILPGQARVYRQGTTSGYGLEDGIPLSQLDARYAVTVRDENSPLTRRTVLDFQGAGVTATDDATNGKTIVNIPGGSGGGSLSTMAASLTSDLAMGTANSVYTVLSINLAVGTWLVNAGATILATAAQTCDVWVGFGTAAGSISAQPAGTTRVAAANIGYYVGTTVIVTVTTAGTFLLSAQPNASTGTVKSTLPLSGQGPATGIDAVKIA